MINLPTLYLKCHNFTPFRMACHPLLATSILIFMNLSEKESLVPQYRFLFLHPHYTHFFYKKQIIRKVRLNFSKVKNQPYPN